MSDVITIWQFVKGNYEPLGFVLAVFASLGVAFKWIVERRAPTEINDRIRPTFLSLFGRYQLENMNVCTRDQHGNISCRTVNDVKERDSYFKVKRIIPCLLYRVEPVNKDDRLIIFLRRSPSDKRRSVAFNIVG